MLIIAQIIAGLGLFFIGVDSLATTQREAATPWFQARFKRATENGFRAAGLGLVLGTLTQSSSAVTFIIINLVTAGYSSLARSLPMLLWGNVGTSALVIIASVRLELALFFILGLVGICHYFKLNRRPAVRISLDVAFGVVMLLLGIYFMKAGAGELRNYPAFADFLTFAARSLLLAFAMGIVLSLILQSSATVTIIVTTLASAEVLTWHQAFLIIVGASLGSGLNVWLLSANLRGMPQRISIIQLISKIAGVAALLPVFALDYYGGLPLIRVPLDAITTNIALQLAIVYLALQVLAVAVVMLFAKPVLRFTARIAPYTTEESLSEPKYLYDLALEDPSTSCQLVKQEQARLFQRLLAFTYRGDLQVAGRADMLRSHHVSCLRVADRCASFLDQLSRSGTSAKITHQVQTLKQCNQMYLHMLSDLDTYAEKVLTLVKDADGKPALLDIIWAMEEEISNCIVLLADLAAETETKHQANLHQRLGNLNSGDKFAEQLKAAYKLGSGEAAILREISLLLDRLIWSAQWCGEQTVKLDEDDTFVETSSYRTA